MGDAADDVFWNVGSGAAEEMLYRCPDCRKPNKLTRSEKYAHQHCEECTERTRAMMGTSAAHATITLND